MGAKLITKLSFTHGDVINLGEEYDNYGRVSSISFRGQNHKTTGSTGMPCYVLQFNNSTVQMVVPHSNVKYVLTDDNNQPVEDGANVPDLPEE